MAQAVRDPLTDLELHRQRLEQNLEALRQSLRHWQIWEAEYEGLKEELQALPSGVKPEDLDRVAGDFGGELLTEKEIKQLLACSSSGIPTRTPPQVVELLSRRIEYVQRNIDSIQSQILAVERKIEGVSVLSKPALRNEDGLPITEIYEELDDDGNVISSRTSHPDEAQPQILQALEAVGLKNQDLSTAGRQTPCSNEDASHPNGGNESPISEPPASPNSKEKLRQPTSLPSAKKKSVSFAEEQADVKADSAKNQEQSWAENSTTDDTSAADVTQTIPPSNSRILELDEDDKVIGVLPNTSNADSPDEAALRRQMQAYSMTEVGNIVAQMDIDGIDNDDTYSLDSDDSDEDMDNEDIHGLSRDDHMSPEYIQEMLNLEQKLNAHMIQNMGPRSDLLAKGEVALDPRKLVVQREQSDLETSDDPKPAKAKNKSVRFAEKLDVADSPATNITKTDKETLTNQPKPAPVANSIVERVPLGQPKEDGPRKVSRFKQSRQSAQNATNDGVAEVQSTQQPESALRTMRKDIVERSPATSRSATDEFDPNLVQQQVKSEYYRQRNRMIQKQGGFKRDQEAETYEPTQEDEAEEGGRSKKVSLFKAARVQGGGTW